MKFIVKLNDGEPEKPIDQETLRKWVEIDKVLPDTPVRNAVLALWKPAKDFEFLNEAFEAQAIRTTKQKEVKKSFFAKLKDRVFSEMSYGEEEKPKEVSSAFVYEFIPNPASVPLRLGAALIDWLLLAAFALLLLGVGMSATYLKAMSTTKSGEASQKQAAASAPAKPGSKPVKKELPPVVKNVARHGLPTTFADRYTGYVRGSLWTDSDSGKIYACVNAEPGEALWCELEYINVRFHQLCALFIVATLVYFGFSLGFLAQSAGMWFFGIFIVAKNEEPALPLRTFLFFLLSLPLGFLMPLVSFVMPGGQALHDMLSGTRLIRTAAKPKA